MDYAGIITTTAQSLASYVVDGIHNGSVFPARFLTRTVEFNQGQYFRQPIQTEDSSQGGDFVGMPVMDASAENLDTNLQWEAKGKYQPIVMPWVELAHNKTKAGVVSLTARKMDVAKNAMLDKIATTLTGLGGGDAIEGLDLSTDDSTLSSEYGSLSRTTYGSVINGKVKASTGDITLAALGTQMDSCSPANTTEGTDFIATTKTVWGGIETLLNTNAREMYSNIPSYVTPYSPVGGTVSAAERGASSGFKAIFHRAVPIVKDEKVGSGKVYTLNEGSIKFARLGIPQLKEIKLSNEATKGVYSNQPAPTAFQISPMLQPHNQLGEVGYIVAYGNLINRNPVRSGVMTGVTVA